MNEKQLQAMIVMDFSQMRPEEKGNLWSTRNTTLSERDGQTQKAMGMVAGVSDLIYYRDNRFVAIELKVVGTSHNSKHVGKQIKWGEKMIDAGGEWYIVTSLSEFWDVINGKDVKYTFPVVSRMLEEGKSKIKF